MPKFYCAFSSSVRKKVLRKGDRFAEVDIIGDHRSIKGVCCCWKHGECSDKLTCTCAGLAISGSDCVSGVARGLLQGRTLQLPTGWGVGDVLTKS